MEAKKQEFGHFCKISRLPAAQPSDKSARTDPQSSCIYISHGVFQALPQGCAELTACGPFLTTQLCPSIISRPANEGGQGPGCQGADTAWLSQCSVWEGIFTRGRWVAVAGGSAQAASVIFDTCRGWLGLSPDRSGR